MKATQKITNNTIKNLLDQTSVPRPGKVVARYNLNIYTDKQIEELIYRMSKSNLYESYSKDMLRTDLSIERRDRIINKVLA
jgi:hypothetical protein